ncbi:MAG: hypothetical protein ACLR7D_14820 [Lachnospira eligens]
MIAQIIIFIAVPNKIMCAVGLLAGCLYAVFSSFHLSFTIRKVVYGGHKQSSTLVFGYIVRFLVMIVLLALLYIFKGRRFAVCNYWHVLREDSGISVAFTDTRKVRKGENSTGEFPQTDKNIIEKESE